MTREEAIRRIKAWNLDSDDREVLAVIIPELAESEDERIRKQLIDAIKIGCSNSGISFTEEAASRYIAWLEKQKKPHYTKRNALFDKCVENCDPNVMREVSDEIDKMLEKERKTAEWSEEDEDAITTAIRACRYMTENFENSTKQYEDAIERLKSLRNRGTNCTILWKPTEEQMSFLWSIYQGGEEQEPLRELIEQLKKLM